MTVGELTAFLSYVLQVLNSVMMFSGVFLQLTRSLTSARRIRAVLEEQPALATPAVRSKNSSAQAARQAAHRVSFCRCSTRS